MQTVTESAPIDLATELRRARGLELAKRAKIKSYGQGVYIVPAASHRGTYAVVPTDGGPTCTCPDYEERQMPCKHIFAVEFTRRTVTMSDGSVKSESTLKVTYRQDWPAYNQAQCAEKEYVAKLLRGLCDGIEEEPQKGKGERRLPKCDRVFAITMKVYDMKSARRSDTEMREWAAKGYMSKAPSYNSVCEYMEDAALAPVLRRLIEQSAAPLAAVETQLAVDSSGFSSQVYRRWYDAKYGKEMAESTWLKAHVTVGTRTNVIASARVTDGSDHDSPEFPALINAAARQFKPTEISADKGYLSVDNLNAVAAIGATPFIAFKENSREHVASHKGSDQLWTKMFHFFQFKRGEFLSHYNRRSNVETTFHMVKSKFGGSLRSKTRAAQENELLCKLLCHNLSVLVHEMFELGIMPTFFPQESTHSATVIDFSSARREIAMPDGRGEK
jgi:transposase